MSKSKEEQLKDVVLRNRIHGVSEYNDGEAALARGSRIAPLAFKMAYVNFLFAAKHGDSTSAGFLGLMYQNGYGVDTSSVENKEYNFTRAIIWFARAIKLCERKGDAAAMHEKSLYEEKLNTLLEGQTLEEFGLPAEAVDDYMDATAGIAIPNAILPTVYDEDEIAALAPILTPEGLAAALAEHAPVPAAAAAASAAPAAPDIDAHAFFHSHAAAVVGGDHHHDCS